MTQPKRVRGPHHHVEAAVDWCSLLLRIFNLSWCLNFFSFHLVGFLYYSSSQDEKASRLSCFLLVYLSHLLRLKVVRARHSIPSTPLFGVRVHILPDRPVSALVGLLWSNFFIVLSPFWMSLTNSSGALQQSDRCVCVVYQNFKSHSLRVRRGVPTVFDFVLLSLFISDLSVSLSSSVGCFFILITRLSDSLPLDSCCCKGDTRSFDLTEALI